MIIRFSMTKIGVGGYLFQRMIRSVYITIYYFCVIFCVDTLLRLDTPISFFYFVSSLPSNSPAVPGARRLHLTPERTSFALGRPCRHSHFLPTPRCLPWQFLILQHFTTRRAVPVLIGWRWNERLCYITLPRGSLA